MSDHKHPSSRPTAGPINTRIAPSPSGMFHIGTARTAYHNWLAARASGGKFLVRIDDTNAEKSHQEYVDLIYDALGWLGLDHDLTFRQSDRLDRYREVVQELRDKGHAINVDGAVALCSPDVPETFFDVIMGHIKVSQDDADKCDRMILVRSDGMPTYQFATVVDDHDYDINYIIRGQDHVSNTPRQLSIYRTLGWDVPLYAHVGLIHVNKKKLSKRDKDTASLLDYRDKGYDPDAMLNYLLRLGWGPYVDDKSANFIPRERALELFFEGGKMRSSAANFDQVKLDSLNRKYKALKEKK